MSLELDLASSIDAAAEARRALDRFEDVLPALRMRDARLLLSELVTNAVRHAGAAVDDPIHLLVEAGAAGLRVEVCDGGSGFVPVAAAPTPVRAGGWGLYLVEELADRWGVDRRRGDAGNRVWFEIDR